MARNYIRWFIRPVAHCKEGCCSDGKVHPSRGDGLVFHFLWKEEEMFRKISLIVIASLFVFAMSELSFAMMCHGTDAAKQAAVKESANVGNKICPVTGAKIDEKLKATYEYEGKIYNFCCSACIEEFKKDPEKYIKKIEEEAQAEPEEDKSKQEAGTSHHGHQMP